MVVVQSSLSVKLKPKLNNSFIFLDKSAIWCGNIVPPHINAVDPLNRGVPRSATAGFHLLGAPVGNIPFSRDAVEERIRKIAEIFDHLPEINDAQTKFSLLRSCFSLPKLSYCLQTCDPGHLLPTYKAFDQPDHEEQPKFRIRQKEKR